MDAAIGGVGVVRATRRTEVENMPAERDAGKGLRESCEVMIVG